MIYLIEIRAETDLMCNTNRFRPPKYEFLDGNLFVFHMRSRASSPPRRPPMMYVVIGSFSHELQMIYVAGARTAEIRRFRGFTGFRVYALTEPPKRTYAIHMTYVVIGSFSHELQIISTTEI